MFPFPWFWWNIRFPFSGDLVQDIAPQTVWDLPFSGPYVGDRELERRILAEAAGYGEQLGTIMKMLDKLLDNRTLMASEEGRELAAMKERIQKVKDSYYEEAENHARTALDRLEEKDPQAYASLVKEQAKRFT